MKKIFRKNNKLTVILRSEASSGSYQSGDYTPSRSDSEHTQSSQTRNNGRFRMTPNRHPEGETRRIYIESIENNEILRSLHSLRMTNFLDKGVKLAQTAALTLALSFFIAAPAMAQDPVPTLDRLNQEGVTMPDSSEVYPESAYTLTEIENADPSNLPQNAITLYDKNDDGTVTPKYYTVSLKQTEFGDKENYGEKLYFKWEKTDNKYSLVEANESDADITYYVNNTRDDSNRITTNQNGADITANFKNLGGSNKGGAIYNSGYLITIGDITGDFIGNYASGSSAGGGAIYNDEGTIGNITGDFIGNYASSTSGYASGGAIYNAGTIENLTANFIGNSVKYQDSSGGAVFNSGNIINFSGNFIGNYNSGGSYVDGGALANTGTIENLNANFIGNYVGYSRYTSGGAIYNVGIIRNITGDFISNYTSADSASSGAGAIYNCNGGVIENITGDFIRNYTYTPQTGMAYGAGLAYGGAIQNNSDGYGIEISIIKNINGNFIENYAKSNHISAEGGAVYNSGKSIIENITANFTGNYASATNYAGLGGAIANYGIIGLNNNGNILGGIVNSKFIGNYAETRIGQYSTEIQKALGGAIYTNQSLNIIARDNGESIFSGNYTKTGDIKIPNAIYVQTGDNTSLISPQIKVVSIDNNKVTYQEITEDDVPSSIPILTLNANTNGTIIFDDTIDGNILLSGITIITILGDVSVDNYYQDYYSVSSVSELVEYIKNNTDSFFWYQDSMTDTEILTNLFQYGYLDISNEQTISAESDGDKYNYTLAITGDSTGKVVLNNDIINANISLDNTNLYLGREDVFDKSVSLSLNSGSIYMNNQSVGTMHVPTLNLNGNTNISIDADLANKSMDRITADTYNVKDNAMLNVNNVVLLSDAKEDTTNILFADKELASNVAYTGVSPIAYSPIYKYEVTYNPDDGFFTFSRGGSTSSSSAYNPAVIVSPVATQAGAYTTQLQTFNYAFQHADTFMNIPYLERVAIINQGKYAMSPTGDATDVGTYSPLLLKEESAGFWVKPYASFENVPLKNGPKVSNINYGTLVGYDSPLTSVGNGFERVLTGYIGYNGASQRYSGVDAYQNGGLLGGTATFYKGNFFNATTLSVGASAEV